MKYDAVISLGSFCQVGAALWMYDKKNINSPLDNFGIKEWRNISVILKSRFKDYWQIENMAKGKAVTERSSKHGDQREIYKAYDNHYNLVSNHNFLADENPGSELATYPEFREKLQFLEKVFLEQCKVYDNIRFVLKAMNWPNPEETSVELSDILELNAQLVDLRGGKDFDFYISIPKIHFEKIQTELSKTEFNHIKVFPWEIGWNNEPHPEWDVLLKDAEVDENYYWRLVSEVIGDTKINLNDVNCF